jgi:signal transduction histidine kinase
LVRLLRNLLENARRHSCAEHISVTVRPLGSGAQILVDDDGDGIPEALRERIFEPFYRPPGMREGHDRGVGLGLALVRQIAERHGGKARCDAHPVGGTRFVVELAGGPPVVS